MMRFPISSLGCLLFSLVLLSPGHRALAQHAELAWMRGGHPEPVAGVVFTSDSRTLVSAGQDGTLRLWNLETGLMTGRYDYPSSGGFLSLAIARDGSRVVLTTNIGAILQISTVDWTLLRRFDLNTRINGAAYSPDASLIAVALGTGQVQLLDASTGATIRSIAAHSGDVNALDFSPDGLTLASVGSDYATRLWQVSTGTMVWGVSEIQYPLYAVRFSPDGAVVAGLGYDSAADFKERFRGVALYESSNGTRREVYLHGFFERVVGLAFSPEGRYLVAAAEDFRKPQMRQGPTISVADRVGSRSWGHMQEPHDGPATCIAWSPDGTTIAWGNYTGSVRWVRHEPDTTVPFVVPRVNTVTGHIGHVRAVALSPDESSVASGGVDGELMIANARTGRLAVDTVAHSMETRSIAYTPDGTRIATASEDGTVKVWSSTTLEPYRLLYLSAGAPVSAASYDLQGNIVASLGTWDSAAVVVDSTEASVLRRFDGGPGQFRKMALASDGRRLVTGGNGGTLLLFDASTTDRLVELTDDASDITGLAMTPDHQVVISGNDAGVVAMRDATSLEAMWSAAAHRGGVGAVAVSGNSRYAASAGADSTIVIWSIEAESLREILRIREYRSAWLSLTLDRTGSTVFGGTADGSVVAYRLDLTSGAVADWRRDSDSDVLVRLGAPRSHSGSGFVSLPIYLSRRSNISIELRTIQGTLPFPSREVTLDGGPSTLEISTGDLVPGWYLVRVTCQGCAASAPLVVTR